MRYIIGYKLGEEGGTGVMFRFLFCQDMLSLAKTLRLCKKKAYFIFNDLYSILTCICVYLCSILVHMSIILNLYKHFFIFKYVYFIGLMPTSYIAIKLLYLYNCL